ncbi:MAG: beta-lactamase family protein [Chloroflexota bacterium]|nr:beta-lactamase family protein [Chloroflexota bacterium]
MDQATRRTRSSVIDRRRALQLAAAGAGLAALSLRAAAAQADASPAASPVAASEAPISGEAVAELADFDALMTALMLKWTLPGGQLAIAHEGRLVYNRGFGYASVEDREVVTPDMTFRIASVSKTITAVAILKLVDAGELTLDTPVFPLLALEGPPGSLRDPRLDTITIEHLLVHSGGWNSTAFDPQNVPMTLLASQVLRSENPAEAETIVRYMLSQPLDFDPGSLSVYSNFGFNVLGRVIEHVSGQPYEDYVKTQVLGPIGITTMAIGGTTLAERMPGEVRYYGSPEERPRESVFPGGDFGPPAYGAFYLRSLDAHGGWIAAAADLVRFTLAIDGTLGSALLTPETVTAMETTPRPSSEASGAGNVDGGFGLGWYSVPVGAGYEWSHAGALIGSTSAWLVRKPGGTVAALAFNSQPQDAGGFFAEIIQAVQELLDGTTAWPARTTV